MDISIGNSSLNVPSLTAQLLTISIISLRRTVNHRSIQTQKAIQNNYDYIVVGSGTSGAIVAGRLSEDPTKTVLVIEAGGPQTVTSDSPSYSRQQFGTDIDWRYSTVPQSPYAGNAFRDGRINISRGRIVGGSHNMNFLAYSRGSRYDFDSWAQPPYNADGWSFDDVLPYFLKSENNTDPKVVANNPEYHSTSGPVVIQTPSNPDPIIEIMKQTLISDFGVPLVDQNGPTQVGISNFQQTIFLNGTRATTASCYLEANINRTNLQVQTESLVTRILFDETRSELRAIGVEYIKQGRTYRVYANREVILSAGSINTPQLLMLSGVGPRRHLQELGIRPLLDLQVGKNLYDHVYVQLDYEILDSKLVTSGIDWNLQNMYEEFVLESGPLTQFPLVYLYTNSRYNNQTDYPDIQIDFQVIPISNDLEHLVSLYDPELQEQWRDYYRPHLGQNNHLGILCFLYRPKSFGELRLKDSNPESMPLLDMRYLTDKYDIQALTDSIRQALIMVDRSTILRGLLKPWHHPIPGCELCKTGKIYDCQKYLECYARSITASVGHQVGTTKMSSRNDPTAVVDPRLKVIGTSNLRVVDGSIFPYITNGNTNAPCMMIGEMGAMLIKEDNR